MASLQGWGRQTWNSGAWDTFAPVDSTGNGLSSALGSLTLTGDCNITLTGIGTTSSTGTAVGTGVAEVSASGTYAEGGGALTSVTPTLSGDAAVCDFSDISFTSATISAQAAVIYNSSTVSGLTTNAAVAVLDFGDISFTSATISAQAAVIYNSSTVSGLTTNASVCVLDFGAVKSSTSGTFTITFPAAEATAAILRIA